MVYSFNFLSVDPRVDTLHVGCVNVDLERTWNACNSSGAPSHATIPHHHPMLKRSVPHRHTAHAAATRHIF